MALSLKPCTDLLNNIQGVFKRLEKSFEIFESANMNYKISGQYYFLLTVH